MTIQANTYMEQVEKQEISEALKQLRASTEPVGYRAFKLLSQDGAVLLNGDVDDAVTCNFHMASNKYNNKVVQPESDKVYGSAVLVDKDITATLPLNRLMYLFMTKLGTHIDPEDFVDLDPDAVLDITDALLKAEGGKGVSRKPSVFRNPSFIELLVGYLHKAGKDTTKDGTPLDAAYLLSLDATTLKKAFTKENSPFLVQYNAAMADLQEGKEVEDENII